MPRLSPASILGAVLRVAFRPVGVVEGALRDEIDSTQVRMRYVKRQIWRWGWDSNPRSLSARWFSRPELSATQPPHRARVADVRRHSRTAGRAGPAARGEEHSAETGRHEDCAHPGYAPATEGPRNTLPVETGPIAGNREDTSSADRSGCVSRDAMPRARRCHASMSARDSQNRTVETREPMSMIGLNEVDSTRSKQTASSRFDR